MTSKVITVDEAVAMIPDGTVLMVGGFAASGHARLILQGIVEAGRKNLTLISNDTGDVNIPGKHIGILTLNHCVKKAIVSHIGMNRETVRQFNAGELEIEFCPQGTLTERARAAGYGLGGVLTPTGVGTDVAIGKQVINVDGRDYLLEKPLFADVCIAVAKKADTMGNCVLYGSAVSHTTSFMTAAKTTIVQAEQIVEPGEIAPEDVTMPGIFVDYLVEGTNDYDERTVYANV